MAYVSTRTLMMRALRGLGIDTTGFIASGGGSKSDKGLFHGAHFE